MHSDATDRINELTKLVMHRLAARVIGSDSGSIEIAKASLQRMEDRLGNASYMDDWREILKREPREVRRKITERSQNMDRLRKSSPFLSVFRDPFDFRDPDLRRRLWTIGKRIHTLRIAGKDAPWSPGF